MVNVDSFKFNEEYNQAKVNVSIPNRTDVDYYNKRYIKSVIIATHQAYDCEKGDIDLGEEELRGNTTGDYTVIYYKYGVKYLITTEPDVDDPEVDLTPYKSLSGYLFIDGKHINLKDIFLVKVEDAGDWSASTPCQITSPYTWESLYDYRSIDAKGMEYLSELVSNNCEAPEGLIDYILNRQAIDVAAGCGDYTAMIARYNDMLNSKSKSTTFISKSRGGCGCL